MRAYVAIPRRVRYASLPLFIVRVDEILWTGEIGSHFFLTLRILLWICLSFLFRIFLILVGARFLFGILVILVGIGFVVRIFLGIGFFLRIVIANRERGRAGNWLLCPAFGCSG